ncbi:TetR/AcrR family transcriptional regulator [Kitasatospora sp. NPDC057512]|uniref:TetR/AcrR family transcriptional regulator n=1 Tax=Kitasatospora sp. NPDC057512 TaxID=3346154 RepID=UPI00369A2E09
MPPTRRRSTRDRPAKPPLSEEAVVDAALEVLRSEGLPAVSMRRVATALDTGPASLYVYVANREGLIHAMQDRIFATVELETADPAHWRDQLHTLLGRLRDALAAHPGIAMTLTTVPPRSEAVLRPLENMLAVLLAGGLTPQDAAWAADFLSTLVHHAAVEAEARPVGHHEQAEELYRHFTAQSPDAFPLITAHAAQLVAGDAEERFRLAVDTLIDGFLTRAASPPA